MMCNTLVLLGDELDLWLAGASYSPGVSSKFETKLTSLPPVTKMAKLPRLQLYTHYRKSTCPLTPTCVTSFMNAPPQSGGGGGY